ncbi:tetratricopeptide repeat protein [Amaricoccus solimangrovi]|uniref:Tetratricopeptide repeat protein n=1 Tax=Amaricoccus solimangrovi TaxID=2589815 RepID=A0A501WJL9_9RHOB|nr:tetratricopeptide repeat protein [Amaricoccus solimangrovi]TPE48324.1 tetratricopeptide repeat protein [Amaricoccus solimangrovi]
MAGSGKRQRFGHALAIALIGAAPAFAQDAPAPESPDPPKLATPSYDAHDPASAPPEDTATAAQKQAAALDRLYGELADPGRRDWEKVQAEIERLWARSGSPAMDLLLRRAGREMRAENYPAAVDHLTALTELAPGFAEGWNARATAFYQLGEFSLAVADLEHVLALNPRHFGALTGLGIILDQTGQPAPALEALRAARALNPNRPDINDQIRRVERSLGAADL